MISKKEVEHIAKLARIKLTDKEVMRVQKELSAVLDYFEMIKELDVSKVKPTFYPHENKMETTRDDIIKTQSVETVNKLLELAPDKDKRRIKVKAVFE